ncbi:hypothetical protein ACFSSC_04760 [Corynebacterium mendelii]|uniref:Uncharacterized protein n=1 Tax=Corynebacterium mendelii TaxID=2765362 RepID=A0A939DYR9_9CORY|nr:hypothetical protein [Corynebacterium mendelii]MBN9643289.1 hypothetical protein [Corynebacterium mendelii]
MNPDNVLAVDLPARPARISMVNLLPLREPKAAELISTYKDLLLTDGFVTVELMTQLMVTNRDFVTAFINESTNRYACTWVIYAWGVEWRTAAKGWIGPAAQLFPDEHERQFTENDKVSFGFFPFKDELPLHPFMGWKPSTGNTRKKFTVINWQDSPPSFYDGFDWAVTLGMFDVLGQVSALDDDPE